MTSISMLAIRQGITNMTYSSWKDHLSNYQKPILIFGMIVSAVCLAKDTGLYHQFTISGIESLLTSASELHSQAPLIYILIFIVGCLLFCPAPPFVIGAGVLFGPVMAALLTAIAAAAADSIAFFIARYAARDLFIKWAKNNPKFRQIDDGVKQSGWKILVATRLIPIFPYMLQSYAYGITSIRYSRYVLISWLCTLPGIVAFSFMGGSFKAGQPIIKMAISLTCGVFLLLMITYVPRYLLGKKTATLNKP